MNLKKIIISLVVLCAIFLLSVQIFLNPLLERAKPLLLEAASKSFKTAIAAEKIEVSVFPSLGFKLENVKFGEEHKQLTLGLVSIKVSLKAALMGEVNLRSAEIENVNLSGMLASDGTFSINGLSNFQQKNVSTPNAGAEQESKTPSVSREVNKNNIKLSIESLLIKNILITILNEKTHGSLKVVLDQFDFVKEGERGKLTLLSKIADGSINFSGYLPSYRIDPRDFSVEGTLSSKISTFDDVLNFLGLSKEKVKLSNLNFLGEVKYPAIEIKDLTAQYFEQEFHITGKINDLKLGGGQLNFQVPKVELAKLYSLNEKIKGYEGSFEKLNCDLEILGKTEIKSTCNLANSKINTASIGIKDLIAQIKLVEPKNYNLNNLTLELAQGKLEITGQGAPKSASSFKLHGAGIDIAEASKLAPDSRGKSAAFAGKVSAFDADITILEQTKNGKFSFELSPFSIKGFNLFKKVSDAIELFPGLSLSLAKALPQSYIAVLLSENSEFQQVKASGQVQNSKIILSEFQAQSKGYKVIGHGTIENSNLDLNVRFIIEKDLVSEIEVKKPEIAKIKNQDGSIVIPVQIKKTNGSTPLIYPDVENLLKQQVGIQLKDNAKKALEKVSPGLGGLVDGLLN